MAKSLFAVSPEKGAETLVHLAASPEVEGQSGDYYVKRRIVSPSRAGRDDAAAVRLWDATARITGAVEPPGLKAPPPRDPPNVAAR